MGSFLLGTICAGISAASAFYTFLFAQAWHEAAGARFGSALDKQYNSIVVDKVWITRDDTPSTSEVSYLRKTNIASSIGQVFGWLSGFLFIVGSIAGTYIVYSVGCSQHAENAAGICSQGTEVSSMLAAWLSFAPLTLNVVSGVCGCLAAFWLYRASLVLPAAEQSFDGSSENEVKFNETRRTDKVAGFIALALSFVCNAAANIIQSLNAQ